MCQIPPPNANVELRPDRIERAERAHHNPAVCSNYRYVAHTYNNSRGCSYLAISSNACSGFSRDAREQRASGSHERRILGSGWMTALREGISAEAARTTSNAFALFMLRQEICPHNAKHHSRVDAKGEPPQAARIKPRSSGVCVVWCRALRSVATFLCELLQPLNDRLKVTSLQLRSRQDEPVGRFGEAGRRNENTSVSPVFAVGDRA